MQPFAAFVSVKGESEMEQAVTGAETEALPLQAQDGLQQSQ